MIRISLIRDNGSDPTAEALEFSSGSLIFGRADGSDIVLGVTGVSRYHARVYVENDEMYVQDLGSTNGTLVNGKRISEAEKISPTDRISLGVSLVNAEYLSDEDIEENKVATPTVVSPPIEEQTSTADTAEAKVELSEEPELNQISDFYWQSLSSFLAPIWSYINDESVSEVMVNGPDEIYIEKGGELSRINARFTEDGLHAAVLNIAQYVGRRISETEPYLDARLPDGSRVAVLIPPCSRKGISIAIRKFAKEQLTVERLIGFGSLSQPMAEFLETCVLLKKNIIVSGGTSSGKTSLLNVVSGFVPADERILTIEDSAELQLTQEHVLPLETKPPDKKGRGQMTIRDLLKASLRMRPDRIIVGEIRGGEAIDLLQAMNTGHSGSMATVHASSPSQSLTRLETLALFSGLEIPMRALREQVSSAIDIVIQASRLPDHSRKITHISEVLSLDESGAYQVRDLFKFVAQGRVDGKIKGEHIQTEEVPTFLEQMRIAGLESADTLYGKQSK